MKKIFKLQTIFIALILSTLLISCTNKNKKVTISNNTSDEILVEDTQIKELIDNGKKFLSDEKYDEAKINFIRAISLDKNNKNIYLQIKDLYIASNRLDDAYYITKIALLNNIDTENMKNILNEISSEFDVIKITETITQNSRYSLPNEVIVEINNNKISLPIFWLNSKVDTSQLRTVKYEGLNEEYGRKIEMEILVTANNYATEYGYIKNIYMKNDKLYADIDLAECYSGDKALEESIKDNKATFDPNDGQYVYLSHFYIRNNSSETTTYELDKSFAYCEFYPHSSVTYEDAMHPENKYKIINYDEFIDKYKDTLINNPNKSFARIKFKNNMIYSIYKDNVYFD